MHPGRPERKRTVVQDLLISIPISTIISIYVAAVRGPIGPGVAGLVSVTCVYAISRISTGILPATIPVAPDQHEPRHNNKYLFHIGY
jgi:hypothetical protein